MRIETIAGWLRLCNPQIVMLSALQIVALYIVEALGAWFSFLSATHNSSSMDGIVKSAVYFVSLHSHSHSLSADAKATAWFRAARGLLIMSTTTTRCAVFRHTRGAFSAEFHCCLVLRYLRDVIQRTTWSGLGGGMCAGKCRDPTQKKKDTFDDTVATFSVWMSFGWTELH